MVIQIDAQFATTLIQNATRSLAPRMRRRRRLRPVSGWTWVIAALGIVIVVLGGLLLT